MKASFILVVFLFVFGKVKPQPFNIIESFRISDTLNTIDLNHIIYTGKHYFTILQSSAYDSLIKINSDNYNVEFISIPGIGFTGPKALSWDGSYLYVAARGASFGTSNIYKIDTASMNILSSIPFHYSILSMSFDMNADNGNGGFWIAENTGNYPIYLIDTLGNKIDSLIQPIIQQLYFNHIIVDNYSFNDPHLIIQHQGPPGANGLVWYNLQTKNLTNYEYLLFKDTDLCSQGRGIFIYDSINYQVLSTMSLVLKDSLVEVINYELGVPPPIASPENDSICQAKLLYIDSSYTQYDNFNSTVELIEPNGSCFTTPLDQTVWFKIPVTNPSFRISQPTIVNSPCSGGFISEFSIYESLSSSCTGFLSEIACSDKNGGPWGIYPRIDVFGQKLGDTLYLQVEGDQFQNVAFIQAVSLPTISRNFELYDTTRFIALYDDEWFLKNPQQNGQAGIDSKVSDEQSFSGAYSLKIEGSEEPEYMLYDLDSSMQQIGFQMYIPSGNESYFELKSSGNTVITEFYFESGGNGFMNLDSTSFTFPYDTWFSFDLYFDLDNERMQLRIDQQPVTLINLNTPGGNTVLHSFLFKPSQVGSSNNTIYIDNMLNLIALFPPLPGSQLNAFNINKPINNTKLVIDNATLYNNVFTWDTTFDSYGSNVDYNLKFYIDSGNLLVEKLSILSNSDTSFTMSEALIDSLYQILGKNTADTLNLRWDVEAKTNLNSDNSANGPFFLDIYRGTYVGLEINDQNAQIKLYPNPNKGELFIESNIDNLKLNIYDLNGQLKFSKTIESRQEKIDIQFLNTGLFLVRMNSESKSWMRKLFVE